MTPPASATMLHADFRWVSHAGERFDRDSYVASNAEGRHRVVRAGLTDISVVAHEQTAVLRCTVVDTVDRGHGPREYRMPMTQVWIRRDGRWVCLAGHAGARLLSAADPGKPGFRPNWTKPPNFR